MYSYLPRIAGKTLREDELELSVDKIYIKPKSNVELNPASEFGQVQTGGYIELTCSLARISIEIRKEKLKNQHKPEYASYDWNWVGGDSGRMLTPDIYLDSPKCDFESIKGVEGRMYCVPGYEDSDGDLTCLLLQSQDSQEANSLPAYRRVGLTVIPFLQGDRDKLMARFGRRQRIRLF